MHPSPPRTELDLITEQDLARHLKICRRQLYNWRIAGLIPYFKMGKAVRSRVADVAEAIDLSCRLIALKVVHKFRCENEPVKSSPEQQVLVGNFPTTCRSL